MSIQPGMNQPLVSIVIPCYNGEQFVADAIRSAQQQTYPYTEIIVVDDGSTDGSLDVIRSFGDTVLCIHQENSGAANAMNYGVTMARGELLQFFDCDDLMHPQKIEKKVSASLTCRPGVVFCNADVIEMRSGAYRGEWGVGSTGTADPVVHSLLTILQTASPLYWRETFDGVGGFRQCASPSYDRDIHMRLASVGVRFHHIPDRLYVMRRVAESLSKRNPEHGLQVQLKLGKEAYARLTMTDGLTEPRLAAFAGYFAGTGRTALRNGLPSLAEECFKLASEIHPDGGFSQAYSPGTRLLARSFGPRLTEQLVAWKRKLFRNQEIA